MTAVDVDEIYTEVTALSYDGKDVARAHAFMDLDVYEFEYLLAEFSTDLTSFLATLGSYTVD